MVRKKSFFKGWYYKQEKGGRTIAFIPAVYFDRKGKARASVQVIDGENSWNFPFPAEAVREFPQKDGIQIGNSFFSPKGIRVDLDGMQDGKRIRILGRLRFGSLTPLRYPFCGPFRFLPMQCRHDVVSMCHRVRGSLFLNGERICLQGGRGYVEKDWGSSFPDWYFWCQMGWNDGGECSVMATAADVALSGLQRSRHHGFSGCAACISFRGREYRLATYLGARIRKCTRNRLLLQQGRLRLLIRVGGPASPEGASQTGGSGQILLAPVCGRMSRIVREKAACPVWCRFWIGKRLVLEHVGVGSAETGL